MNLSTQLQIRTSCKVLKCINTIIASGGPCGGLCTVFYIYRCLFCKTNPGTVREQLHGRLTILPLRCRFVLPTESTAKRQFTSKRTMKMWSNSFKNLSLAGKATTFTAMITISGGLGYVVSYIASTDTVQKFHIKRKLLNSKFPMPPHMKKVNFISRTVVSFFETFLTLISIFIIHLETLHFTRG